MAISFEILRANRDRKTITPSLSARPEADPLLQDQLDDEMSVDVEAILVSCVLQNR